MRIAFEWMAIDKFKQELAKNATVYPKDIVVGDEGDILMTQTIMKQLWQGYPRH